MMDREAAFKFELAFCVFIAALAFLWRGHEDLRYPQFLYSVLALLLVNLAATAMLWRKRSGPYSCALVTLGSCAAITGIVASSGGQDSKFWVIYALPIYTACLLLDGRGLAYIAAGTVLFNAGFQLATTESPAAALFSLTLKSGILLFAAAGGWMLVCRDRAQSESASRQKEEMRLLGDKMRDMETALQETEKVADLGFLSMNLARDIITPLWAIASAAKVLASAHSSSSPAQADIGQIDRSVRLCASLLKRFVLCLQQQKLELGPCPVGAVVASAVEHCAAEARKRRVEVETVLEPGLPDVRASRPHLERALVNLIRRALESMPDGGWIKLRAGRAAGAPRVEVSVSDTGEDAPLEKLNQDLLAADAESGLPTAPELAVYLARAIIRRHNGEVRFSRHEQGGTRVVIDLEAA